MSVSALPANIALITASLDLKLVQLLRAAIHNTDIANSAAGNANNARILPRREIDPEPRIEPRKVIHPTPRIEPRPVHHPEPRIEPTPPCYADPVQPEHHNDRKCAIEPPWAVQPWEQPLPVSAEPPVRIKVVRHRIDMARRGALIDIMG